MFWVFQEATVMSMDASSLNMRYTEYTLSRLSKKGEWQSAIIYYNRPRLALLTVSSQVPGKFSLEDSEQADEAVPALELDEEVELAISDMLEPRLIS